MTDWIVFKWNPASEAKKKSNLRIDKCFGILRGCKKSNREMLKYIMIVFSVIIVTEDYLNFKANFMKIFQFYMLEILIHNNETQMRSRNCL